MVIDFTLKPHNFFMMMKHKISVAFITLLLIVAMACNNKNQTVEKEKLKPNTPVSKELYDTIAHMDSMMFNAFNAHDVVALGNCFSDSLEFFHDKGGLTNYQQTIANFKNLFDRNATTNLRRDIVAGSLEVYPIKNYGAVEICLHRFCHYENGKQDCGTFKNIMIWQNKNNQWKVTRVISYDH
jgi:Domain of unknown function (DUF4440)